MISSEDAAVDEFIAPYPAKIQELVLQARALIQSTIPGAIEMVDPPSKIIAYGVGRKYSELICAIAPYSQYVNLMFRQGAILPDPQHLLLGTGKFARHLKIMDRVDIESPAVRALIQAALAKFG